MLQRILTAKGCGCAGRSGWRVALLTCMVLPAAGCMQALHLQNPAQAPRVIQLHWNWQAHPALFKPASAVLSEDERRRLDDFLNEAAPEPGNRILVDFGGEGEPDPLTRERLDAVTLQLKRHLPGAVVYAYPGGEAPPHGVRVLVGRPYVEIPDCWPRPSGSNPGNLRDSDFGCATVVNLSRMVADPSDFQQGRSLAPGDAQVLSAAVRRYRTDKVKDPVAPETGSVAVGD